MIDGLKSPVETWPNLYRQMMTVRRQTLRALDGVSFSTCRFCTRRGEPGLEKLDDREVYDMH